MQTIRFGESDADSFAGPNIAPFARDAIKGRLKETPAERRTSRRLGFCIAGSLSGREHAGIGDKRPHQHSNAQHSNAQHSNAQGFQQQR